MNQIKKLLFCLLILVSALGINKFECHASGIIIDDQADLLTQEEELMLTQTMELVSEYGGVAFVTNPYDNYLDSASAYAKKLCKDYFNGQSGTVLLIDMNNRRIELYSTGYLYRKINKQRANIITANTYTYATNGDYFQCAEKTFEEINTILAGGRITTPLKYISNLFLSFGISVLILYLVLYRQRNKNRTMTKDKVKENTDLPTAKNVVIVQQKMISQKKSLHTESSSGSSSGGGGFSGGGSSGGGGGHSF